jgi:putative ABC transport system permease protein
LALAWRILAHDKGRTALAVAGVFLAILLVFVQLGFFSAVPRGGMLLYDRTRFELLIASSSYEYQVQPGEFPLGQLDKAKTAPEVALAAPVYFGSAKWRNGENGKAPDVFVIGLDPQDPIFDSEDVNRQPRSSTGRYRPGGWRDATYVRPPNNRPGGRNRRRKARSEGMFLTGFMGLGVICQRQNFVRFSISDLGKVNLGLIQLKPGVDPDHAALIAQPSAAMSGLYASSSSSQTAY